MHFVATNFFCFAMVKSTFLRRVSVSCLSHPVLSDDGDKIALVRLVGLLHNAINTLKVKDANKM